MVRTELFAELAVSVSVPVLTVSAVVNVAHVTVPAFPETDVWSPVLEPETLVVPVTVSAGVLPPVIVTPLILVAVATPKEGDVKEGESSGALRSSADCKSVWAERVPVIDPQVPPPHPPPESIITCSQVLPEEVP